MNNIYEKSREVASSNMRSAIGCWHPYGSTPPDNMEITLPLKGKATKVFISFNPMKDQTEGSFWKFGCYTVENDNPGEIGFFWVEDGEVVFSFGGGISSITVDPAKPVKTLLVPVTTPKTPEPKPIDRDTLNNINLTHACNELVRACGSNHLEERGKLRFSITLANGKTALICIDVITPAEKQFAGHPWIFSCLITTGSFWFKTKGGICYVQNGSVHFMFEDNADFTIKAKEAVTDYCYIG